MLILIYACSNWLFDKTQSVLLYLYGSEIMKDTPLATAVNARHSWTWMSFETFWKCQLFHGILATHSFCLEGLNLPWWLTTSEDRDTFKFYLDDEIYGLGITEVEFLYKIERSFIQIQSWHTLMHDPLIYDISNKQLSTLLHGMAKTVIVIQNIYIHIIVGSCYFYAIALSSGDVLSKEFWEIAQLNFV